MEAIARNALADIVAIADPDAERLASAGHVAPGAERFTALEPMLNAELDGVVIATPNAQHASQAIRALDSGCAVFCQKPLARNGAETRLVIEAARAADRLLDVDLSYRHTAGMQQIRNLLLAGEIGDVYAVDVVFHNAYGPGKAWPYDPKRSGGGCVIDLGIHLVDLALWALDFPDVVSVSSRLLVNGRPLDDPETQVENYAVARLDLAGGAVVSMSCSWNLPAGRDAVIEASFYGTGGGLSMRNVDGSYFDFVTERYLGRQREILSAPPDDWGGRAAVAWVRRLAEDPGFDSTIERTADVAAVLDAIYGRELRQLHQPPKLERNSTR